MRCISSGAQIPYPQNREFSGENVCRVCHSAMYVFAKLQRRFGMESAGLWTLKNATFCPTFLEKCITGLLLWHELCKCIQTHTTFSVSLPWNYGPMIGLPSSIRSPQWWQLCWRIQSHQQHCSGVDHDDDDVDDNKKWEISQHSQVIMTAAPRQACRFIATNGHRYTNVLGITPRIWNIDECTM